MSNGNPLPATARLHDKLSVLDVKRLDHSTLVPIDVAGLPEEKYQIFMEQQQRLIAANTQYLERQHTEHVFPDLSNDPRLKDYATIVIGGKVVAEIDNQGVVTSYDDHWGKRITDFLNSDPAELAGIEEGPATAQARAELFAKLFGGRIMTAPTAMTQQQYNAMPPFPDVMSIVDYAAMRNDQLYEQVQRMTENYERTQQERADFLTVSALATLAPT